MELRFEQFSDPPDPALLQQAATLANGEIFQDVSLPPDEVVDLVTPEGGQHRVYGLLDGELLIAFGGVEPALHFQGRRPGSSEYEVGILAVHPEY